MRRTVAGLLAIATLGLAPVVALAEGEEAPPAPPPCAADDGRELVGAGTLEHRFQAPVVTAPELAATHAQTGDLVTPYRTAVFALRTSFAPATAASMQFTLTWTDPGDYDLSVIDDGTGEPIASSLGTNIEDQTFQEQATAEIADCTDLTVLVRSWAGAPQELRLKIVTSAVESTEGEDGQPIPVIEPGTASDARVRLYLGGDPGPVSMVHSYNENTGVIPFRGTLAEARPTGGVPNGYARPIAGFRDQFRNPFVPHFTTTYASPRDVLGDVTALVWLSSPTADATTKVFADLYADGGLLSSVVIPGTALGRDPAPVRVRFSGIAADDITNLTLQVATEPAAATTGPGNPRDAVVGIHYGSVQFPARITLPAGECQATASCTMPEVPEE